jgi:starch synthase
VFLGQGEERYKSILREFEDARPGHVSAEFKFTDKVEHRLIAGSDLLLMPSEYEPCGLTQMRAQRYGALVIGRRVGGISDTVQDDATGFLFDAFTANAFDSAVGRAMHRYYDRDAWRPRMYEAMGRDFAWDSSASRYVQLYRRALAANNPDR